MSQGAEDGVGKNDDRERPKGDKSDNLKRVERVFLLLDHLQKQGNTRLQAQFQKQRQWQVSPSPLVAKPPVSGYRNFLKQLVKLRKSIYRDPDASIATDEDVLLRQSEDFLAAVAAPATVETIATTQKYIITRTQWAHQGWTEWLRGLLGLSNRKAKSESSRGESIDGAVWLARSTRLLEIWVVIVTCATVALSVYAMVGRAIVNDEQHALAAYLNDANVLNDDYAIALSEHSWVVAVRSEESSAAAYTSTEQLCDELSAEPASRPVNRSAVPLVQTTSGLSVSPPKPEFEPASSVRLEAECRKKQWALMQLVAENIRLKSWDNSFIDVDAPIVGRAVRWLIGWDEGMISQIGRIFNEQFCRGVAASYGEQLDERMPGCAKLIQLLVRDSESVSESILGCVTMFVLPALYAFIGAAAATMLWLRQRADSSCLSYTDRGLIKYNLILGIVFGGVIGLFAGYLSDSNTNDKLGLSALALLAGYNVPAASAFLLDLSNRVFRPQKQRQSHA